ncbi:MAG: phosphomannomutase/phosphoglucomutase [Phycisphaeraceae bacterium]|nr:phosphomannomutase/phosphoglucomutase [Phycisphaeraceae bacterium]
MLSKIFKAYDIRAIHPDPLSEEAAWKVGYATGQYLIRAGGGDSNGKVLVSRDMRPSSPALSARLIDGLRCSGTDVVDLGMCDTSFIYFAINHLDAVGGIQVTASHNPIDYNGFKISGRQARPIGQATGLADIQRIAENLPANIGPGALEPTGRLESMDLWDDYRRHVLKFFTPPRRPIKVFVDGSNGMAGVLVPKVFSDLENVRIIPLNFEIGQGFAHEPNPLVAENMIPTQEGVRDNSADVGACFDGDADRCMFTDETGEILGCDHLTAMMAHHFALQEKGSSIVYDLRSSKAVEQTIRELGGKPIRSRVGHVFMKAKLKEADAIFGGELSGHFYFRDSFYTDSGAVTFALILSLIGASDEPLSRMIQPYRKYPQSGEMNFRNEDKEGVFRQIRERFGNVAQIDELDGVTVDAWSSKTRIFEPDGTGGFWFNVRASNTEPLLRLNAEAVDQQTLKTVLENITPILGEHVQGH